MEYPTIALDNDQKRVCQRAKESFEKSLNLFVHQDWVEVTLDV